MSVTPARLGFVVPSTNTTFEPEIYRALPVGVTAHFVRAHMKEDSEEDLAGMAGQLRDLGRDLKLARVSSVAFACTGASALGGAEAESQQVSALQESAGCPATTTSSAVVHALQALGINRVSVATPYEDWLTERVCNWLESAGVVVTNRKGLGLRSRISDLSSADAYRLAREVDDPGSEAVFISCTAWKTFDVIDALEGDLGKPVVSSNLATLWQSMKLSEVAQMVGPGSLFALRENVVPS